MLQQHLVIKQPLFKKVSSQKRQIPFLIKLFNWEYWSFSVIYAPIYFYWFYLCIRAKSLFFFSASNPAIENGGFLMERKSDIFKIIPQQYFPKTFLVQTGFTQQQIVELIKEQNFVFPVIVKPDIGFKGSGVRKIQTPELAAVYIHACNFPMLVQQLIPYKNEVGIFYYRFPWATKGKISGIVAKEFVTVTGNGISTVEELIIKHPRYVLQLAAIKKMPEIDLTIVLPEGQQKILVPFGNHARGAKFIDVSNKISVDFENSIDEICKQIPGFYFGRLDVMFNNWEQLAKGKNLSIVELNGAGSEPTHMYDPSHTIFFAWKEIARHLKLLYRISIWNNKNNAAPYLSFKEGINMFRQNSTVEKKLKKML